MANPTARRIILDICRHCGEAENVTVEGPIDGYVSELDGCADCYDGAPNPE